MTTATKTDLKSAILHQLNYGKHRALTGAVLAQRLGEKDTRTMRLAIRELQKDFHPVCSLPGVGYFLAEAPDEIEECMKILHGYCVESAIHRRDMKRCLAKMVEQQQKPFGQTRLFEVPLK